MTDTLEVRYKKLPIQSAEGVWFYHKYLVYTVDAGLSTQQQFYVRGGPSVNYGGEGFLIEGPLGYIKTQSGPYITGTDDWHPLNEPPEPNEILVTATDSTARAELAAKWDIVKETVADINDQKLAYLGNRNSNSTVDTGLYRAGLPMPQNDDIDEYATPGTGNIIATGNDVGFWESGNYNNDKYGNDFLIAQSAGHSITVDNQTYDLPDVVKSLIDASQAIAQFIQSQTEAATKWFTAEDGANMAFAQWLGQNMQNLVEGNLDPEDAFIDLAQYLGERFVGHQFSAALSTSEAHDLMVKVFESFGLPTATAQSLSGGMEQALVRMAIDFALHSSGWNSQDYLNAGILTTTSVITQEIAKNMFPSSAANAAGTVAAVATVISSLLQNDDLDQGDWIMLGVQAGLAYGSTVVGAAFGSYLAGVATGLSATGVGIVAAAVLSIIGSKIIGSIYQGVVFYSGEYGSKAQLINSLYQVQKVDDGHGNMVDALVAVNAQGSTIIMKSGIIYASGNLGSDIIVGDGGGVAVDNVLSGGGGADYLEGRAGNDNLFGGDGNDHAIGGIGDDIIVGGAGDDELFGDEGDDIIQADAGEDFIHAGSGNDAVSGGDNSDIILASAGADAIDGNTGDDVLELGSGDDAADAGDGDDVVLASMGNDVVDGGAGNDDLFGEAGNDQLLGGAGNDTLDGGDGVDILSGGIGDDYLNGGLDDDMLDGGLGDDTLQGGIGNDVLVGGLDNDLLLGDIGDDELNGDLGDDVLIGDIGTDKINGDDGDDKYVFRLGDGEDTVSDTAGADIIVLDQIASANITFTADGNDLLVAYGSGADQIRITDQLVSSKIERLELTDGYVDLTALTFPGGVPSYSVQANPTPAITDINTMLSNLATKETAKKQELANNKLLSVIGFQTWHEALQNEIENTYYNGSQIDVFKRKRSEWFGGNYLVYRVKKVGVLPGDSEVLSYTELKPGDNTAGYNDIVTGVKVTFNNRLFVVEDIWIDGKVASTTIIRNGQAEETDPGAAVRNYHLNNGSNLSAAQRASMGTTADISLGETVISSGIDKFIGSYWNETINGNGGDDYLFGGEGNDKVNGGTGNDWTFGGGGNDIMNASSGDDLVLAGAGNDTVSGGSGNDAIVGGDGADTIAGDAGNDWIDGGTGADTISGGAGNDALDGGEDVDTASYAAATAAVAVNLTTGLATGEGNDTLRAVENVTGSIYSDTITGDAGNNVLSGGAGNDSLSGGDGADTLDGGTGNDSMVGGIGDDTYVVDGASDVVTEASGEGTDTVNSSISYTIGNNIENLALTGSSAINATGNSLNNTLTGNSGINTLSGGAGDDTYVVGASDVVSEGASAGNDTVMSGIAWTLGSNIENLVLTGASVINGTGNTLDNTLTGNSAINTLSGGTGNDTYVVGTGDVVSEAVSSGTDTVLADITWTLATNLENLVLTGTANINGTGNTVTNTITGNAGNNTIDGGAGNDTLIGGAGNDVYTVDSASDVVTESASEGTDTVRSSVTYTISDADVENLTLTGTGNINGTGNASDNTLIGTTGNNILTGGDGNDFLDGGSGTNTLAGGTGNDTYRVRTATDIVSEGASAGTDTVLLSGILTYTLGANVENLVFSGTTQTTGTGNALDNVFTGNAITNTFSGLGGNDTLDGGGGADSLSGGQGNDLYIVDNAGDLAIENASEGTDTVQSSVTYTINDVDVENLTLTGSSNINAIGNSSVNTLTGNSGNNTLDGSTGADMMIGGAGDDFYIIDNASDVVTENSGEGVDTVQSAVTWTLGAYVENMTLSGSGNLTGHGNNLANIINGNTGNNTLYGYDGDDTLNGGAGSDIVYGGSGNDVIGTGSSATADTMYGETGDDYYYANNAGDLHIENANEGNDTIQAALSWTLSANIENLILGGSSVINGTGNASNNTLDGSQNSSANSLFGGAGDDLYIVGASDVASENLDEGTDTVNSSVTYVLGANLENLVLTGTSAINGTGNALNNTLIGNSGINTLTGNAGNDTYIVGAGDVVIEGAGTDIDTVQSDASWTLGTNLENLVLTGTGNVNGTGNTQVNIITGNSGNNTLDGGTGADTLTGGDGNDTYIVDNIGDVVTENATEGTDAVNSSVTYTLGSNVENLTLSGASAINGTGNALDNTITGNSNVNTLTGGAGNDTYYLDHVSDMVVEVSDEGTDTVNSSVSHTLAANVENLVLTGATAVNGTGNALNNSLAGNSGVNTLTGGDGDDYYIISTGDVVVESSNQGEDTIQTDIAWTLATNFENLKLTGSSNINGIGNAIVNVISGNSGSNTLDGGVGADTLVGGAGNDSYIVDDTNDYIVENDTEGTDLVNASASYVLGAYIENLTLTGAGNINAFGNAQANTLTGNTGNNTLDGGAGVDTMIGGSGNDTYFVDDTTDVVTEGVSAGTDTVISVTSFTLGSNVENLTLSGFSSVDGVGNTLNNTLTGNDNNNSLDGGTGADTLIGGAGDDTYVIDNVSDVVTEDADRGIDTVRSSITHTLGANIENLTLIGASVINGTGNALNNTLTGNSGVNTLTGGLGNDVYVVSTSDVVVENIAEGTDTVISDITWTLGNHLENLILTGTGNINATGNALVNTLTGNSGNNVLTGGSGLTTVDYSIATGGVVVNLTAGTATGHGSDTLVSIENVIGSGYADTITGSTGVNTLDGGIGIDTLIGGNGNDLYIVDDSADIITETSGQGTDAVNSSVSYTLSSEVENLTLTGTGSINATGNSSSNTLTGNSGANTLDGGAGIDSMVGGDGDDVYIVDNSSDVIWENSTQLYPNAGKDTVLSSVTYNDPSYVETIILTGSDNINAAIGSFTNGATLVGNSGINTLTGGFGSDTYYVSSGDSIVETSTYIWGIDNVISDVSWTLGSNLEILTLTGSANLNGTGNTLDNTFVSNTGNNTLDGGSGSDLVSYASSINAVVVNLSTNTATGHGTDTFVSIEGAIGSSFNDTLTGDSGVNRLYGGAGNDILTAGDGNDTLDGGMGLNTLTGGTGNDVYYVYTSDDTIVELSSEGTDAVWSAVDYILGSNLENLFLIGAQNQAIASASINATGNSLNNWIQGNSADNVLDGAAGGDTIDGGTGNNYIYGGDGDDALYSDAGNSFYYGGNGNDVFEKSGIDALGDDYYDGGADFDELRYWNENGTYGVSLNLELSSGTDTYGTHDIIVNVEKILASENNDTIIGGPMSETLSTSYGDDVLTDGSGNDSVWGGQDDDTLSYIRAINGGNTDVFYGNNGYDTIRLYFTATEYANMTLQAELSLIETFIAAHQNMSDIYGDTFTFTSFGLTLSGIEALEVYVDDALQGGGEMMMRSSGGGISWMSSLSSEQINEIYSGLTMEMNQSGKVQDKRDTNGIKDSYFVYNEMVGSETVAEIHGFNSDEGDRLDLTYLSKNTDLVSIGVEGLLQIAEDKRGTVVSVDRDGTTGASYGFDETIILSNVAGSDTSHVNVTFNGWSDMKVGTTGNNEISGTTSDDLIYGMAGNDILNGGEGADLLWGGVGADTFMFDTTSYQNIDVVKDFSVSQGDEIDISNLLTEYDSLTEALADFVQMNDSGANSTLSIDRDGLGGAYGFTQVATIEGVTGLTDEQALINSGNLIIA